MTEKQKQENESEKRFLNTLIIVASLILFVVPAIVLAGGGTPSLAGSSFQAWIVWGFVSALSIIIWFLKRNLDRMDADSLRQWETMTKFHSQIDEAMKQIALINQRCELTNKNCKAKKRG